MIQWDDEFDVVCVGYGFAGAAAAVAAHDAGVRVLLLEKAAHPGGISICSAGGIRISRDADASFTYLKETNAGTTPDALLEVLAQDMTRIEGWVRGLAEVNGADVQTTWASANYSFEGGDSFGFIVVKSIPGYDPVRDFTWGRGMRGGTRLFKVMMDSIEKRGIDVRMETPAERLITDGGEVEGILAGGRHIRARGGVVLATGGFEAARDMQAQFWQEKPVYPGAYLGNTGDGIRMAQAVGADLWHMWHYHGTYGMLHPDQSAYPYAIRLHRLPDWIPGRDGREAEIQGFFAGYDDALMPWIIVDKFGRRYMNEYPPYLQDTGHRSMTTYEPGKMTYSRIPSWMIVDDTGCRRGPIGFPAYNDPRQKFTWSDDNRAEIDLGILKQADSIEDMAAAMGCEADILSETIERWNAGCRNGRDRDFDRLAATMMPIEKPPFTFAQLWPLCANTQGGPVHDAAQRVLDPFGNPISGLYAAGECGSVFGHLYMSGGNLAECFIGGKRAGEEAAADLG
ncbi:MAG: FAD-dependent oxidoreductase [Rhodospirillaceae bacterium]